MLVCSITSKRPPLRLGALSIAAASAADVMGEGAVGDDLVYALWNPLDKTSNIDLTDTNHTATNNDGLPGGVRGDQKRETGKWYFEVTMTSAVSSGTGVGLTTGTADLEAVGQDTIGAVMVLGAGALYLDGNNQAFLGSIGSGRVIGIAYDADNHFVWIRRDSEEWNADVDANPVTGDGGIDVSELDMDGLYPLFASDELDDSGTANFGDTPFAWAKPAGFLPWLGGATSGMSADGDMVADAATVDGAGVTSSTGTGDMEAGAGVIEGDGGTPNSGSPSASAAVVDGAGVTSSTGTGAMAADDAVVVGDGEIVIAYSTSYANTGGTGNRTGIITASSSSALFGSGNVNNLINGNTTELTTWFNNGKTDAVLTFDFGSGEAVVINKFKWYQSNTANHGTWKWQSSDDGSSWSDEGSSFTFDGTAGVGKEFNQPGNTTTAHRYWRLMYVSGGLPGTNGGPYTYEIEFEIDGL